MTIDLKAPCRKCGAALKTAGEVSKDGRRTEYSWRCGSWLIDWHTSAASLRIQHRQSNECRISQLEQVCKKVLDFLTDLEIARPITAELKHAIVNGIHVQPQKVAILQDEVVSEEERQQFREYLEWASKTVAAWPEWKRNMLGRAHVLDTNSLQGAQTDGPQGETSQPHRATDGHPA